MGIFIRLAISHSVTKDEWQKVYEESLKLVEAFPLAEKEKINIEGIDTICLIPTKERTTSCGWNDENERVGWDAVGDYYYMKRAEDYYLPRDLVTDKEFEKDAGDAMFGMLPVYMNYNWNDPRFDHIYHVWGAKTQGEPYHIYLLAIGCMIESRLGDKAFVYGDITRGQCKKAVELANQYLAKSIDIPDRCDMERLIKRVVKFPLCEQEQIAVFDRFYLGTKDAAFGEYMRKIYSEKIIEDYWKDRFEGNTIGTVGFDKIFNDYMMWGFDLEKLCHYISFDINGEPQYEKFVQRVMESKFHLKEKNCEDALNIDQEESQPYSIGTQFAQLIFGSIRNKKVDRYIPIEEVRKALINGIGDQCNVNAIIDAYLEEEAKQSEIRLSKSMDEEEAKKAFMQDPSEVFNQGLDMMREAMNERREKYDIRDMVELKYYEAGDTMPEYIKESLGTSYNFYSSVIEEPDFAHLMSEEPQKRCEWLVEHNGSLLLRDKDWKKIFKNIKDNKESFAKYYPMVRVRITSEDMYHLLVAMVINDALYEYCKELGKLYQST